MNFGSLCLWNFVIPPNFGRKGCRSLLTITRPRSATYTMSGHRYLVARLGGLRGLGVQCQRLTTDDKEATMCSSGLAAHCIRLSSSKKFFHYYDLIWIHLDSSTTGTSNSTSCLSHVPVCTLYTTTQRFHVQLLPDTVWTHVCFPPTQLPL